MKLVGWLWIILPFFVLAESSVKTPLRSDGGSSNSHELVSAPPVRLHQLDDHHVVMDNGLVNVTLLKPQGLVTGLQYNGIENLLENNNEANRGYWDVVWSEPQSSGRWFDKLYGTSFKVIMQNEDQIELSFRKTWSPSLSSQTRIIPLNIDKRFIMLRGRTGFYSYAILERMEGWPDLNIDEGRIAFKLQQKLFHYMAVSDERQRVMPTARDRTFGKVLDFPEAVLLTNPVNEGMQGEVDDKYQYSSDIKDVRVHGWTCSDPPTGFWVITPSNEFRAGGPLKQDLTSHVGPTSLAMFLSCHYAGLPLQLKLRNGEAWKKVFGPVFIYLNSARDNHPRALWQNAKSQMLIETKNWPYDFPLSENYPRADQRGRVTGRLRVQDGYMKDLTAARSAYVGLALPGEDGSWQTENKGYQFWTQADDRGRFLIKDVRIGNYYLYAWVPGVIGNYRHDALIYVKPGSEIELGVLVYSPPRNGPTLWEIGIPDRTAAEFYVPDPIPTLMNRLNVKHQVDKFRQYGLWDRYADLYPDQDLTYTVGISNYTRDWFFAHVNRNIGNKTYIPTTWKILFNLKNANVRGTYTLQLALASSNAAELQVRINNPKGARPLFTTGLIGKDNAIARYGIHGLYRLYSVGIQASQFVRGRNTIYLTQPRGSSPFRGLMYDYIRLEGPPAGHV